MKSLYFLYDFIQDPALYKDSYLQLDRIEGGISYHYQILTAYPTFIEPEDHERGRLLETAFLGIGKLKPKAKLTHFIADRYHLGSMYTCYMIVSKEIMNKFKNLNLGQSKAYSLPLLHKKKLYEYSLFVIQNSIESIQENNTSLPDIISVKEGLYNVPYFSVKANHLIENELDLGLTFKGTKEF